MQTKAASEVQMTSPVIPAQAGIHNTLARERKCVMGSRLRGNDRG